MRALLCAQFASSESASHVIALATAVPVYSRDSSQAALLDTTISQLAVSSYRVRQLCWTTNKLCPRQAKLDCQTNSPGMRRHQKDLG